MSNNDELVNLNNYSGDQYPQIVHAIAKAKISAYIYPPKFNSQAAVLRHSEVLDIIRYSPMSIVTNRHQLAKSSRNSQIYKKTKKLLWTATVIISDLLVVRADADAVLAENLKEEQLVYTVLVKKDKWTSTEAACLLKRRQLQELLEEKSSNFVASKDVKQLLEIIRTWNHNWYIYGAHPFDYINKAVLEGIEIPEILFDEIKIKFKKISQIDSSIIAGFPYIAAAAGLSVTKENFEVTNKDSKNLSDKERKTLLLIIAALVKAIPTISNGTKYIRNNEINKEEVIRKIMTLIIPADGRPPSGLSETNLRGKISEALKIFDEEIKNK